MTAALPWITLVVGLLILAALPIGVLGYDRRLTAKERAR